MFRIVLGILIIGVSLFLNTLSLHSAGVMTDSSFTIELGQMDPLAGSHNNRSSISGMGGVEVLKVLLGRIADILLFTIPVIAAVSLLIAGYFYIFSAGDSEKATKAKTIIKWNIIAIIVALLSYGIVNLVASFFNQAP